MFNKIKALCDERQISIYQLAKETGISNQIFFLCRQRNNNLSAKNLKKVAEYFGKPMEFFVDENKEE